jgi:hypothetical protein
MNIAITGHTSGIGKYIFENYPNVKGLSRTNKYDISTKEGREKIIFDTKKTDVLINNAYCEFAQSSLLLDFFKQYRWCEKIIVNIGSEAAEGNKVFEDNISLLEYRTHKRSLKDLCAELNRYNKVIDIKYISFGYVWIERDNVKSPLLDNYLTVKEASGIIMESI